MSVGKTEEISIGTAPIGRTEYGLCNVNNIIYMFGGCTSGQPHMDDFWYINCM